jgi:hypothetical protein
LAPPSPRQLAWRGRIEAVLRVAGPFLDALLAAGERVSRSADRDALDAPAPAGGRSRARERVGAGDGG